MIRPGEEWGEPASGEVPIDIAGDDAALARAVSEHPGALVRLRADTDIGRAVGAGAGTGPGSVEVPMDVLDMGALTAVNMVVLGPLPPGWSSPAVPAVVRVDGRDWFKGRATTVVIATGEFRGDLDVVPRGHPGDGRAEVQVYSVARRERRQLAERLRSGSHVPHPKIAQRSGRTIEVRFGRNVALEVDGVAAGRVGKLGVVVRSAAYRLLV